MVRGTSCRGFSSEARATAMRTRSLAFSVAFSGSLHVHPGVLVADIGHLEEVLVEPGVDQGLPEQGLVGDGRAGRHHHPVELLFLDDLGHGHLGILGAGKEISSTKATLGSVLA